jgi:predicted nucleic acid-binding protein
MVEMNHDILLSASTIREQHHLSFWDSLILATALHTEATILYSEDMQDGFGIGKTRVKNPFGLISNE